MRRHKIVTGLNGESVDHQPYYPQNADSFPAFLAPEGFFPFDSVILTSALRGRGIIVKSPSQRGVAEEAPGAYKDVDEVVDATEMAGLAKKVAKLTPVICIKG
jgi:hypothetical protein